MKGYKTLILLLLAVFGADAFTTKQRERHPAFQNVPVVKDTPGQEHSPPNNTPMFAFPLMAHAVAIQQEESEDELDIGYGTALLSCVLSIAVGFGLGYGT
jgi:hypothetical protein